MFLTATIVALVVAILAVTFAVRLFQQILAMAPLDQGLANAAQDSGRAFLHGELRYLALFSLVAFLLIGLGATENGLGMRTACAFLLGNTATAGASYFGMQCTTSAGVRLQQALKTSLRSAHWIALMSGAVVCFAVIGVGLFAICLLLICYGSNGLDHMLGFGLGASSIALFLHADNGIRTQGSDLANGVVSMGACRFESFVSAIIAAVILGWSLAAGEGDARTASQAGLVIYPVLLAALGLFANYLSIAARQIDIERAPSASRLAGLCAAGGSLFLGGALLAWFVGPTQLLTDGGQAIFGPLHVYLAMVLGIVLAVVIAVVIGWLNRLQAKQHFAATLLFVPLLAFSIWACNSLAGTYGIGIAALGMLSMFGYALNLDISNSLAADRADTATQNELAATGREQSGARSASPALTGVADGIAICSAAFTAIALLAAYRCKLALSYSCSLGNIGTVFGMLIGAMLPFLLSAKVRQAVSMAANLVFLRMLRRQQERAAQSMLANAVNRVRRMASRTPLALRKILALCTVTVLLPALLGMSFDPATVDGLLIGCTTAGLLLVLSLCATEGKRGDARVATEEATMAGDKFRAGSGPSILILIKLLPIAALLTVPLFK
ncbi:MAG: sodium/proton-translocating pyrophosphatase [Planctomycetota bacterium]